MYAKLLLQQLKSSKLGAPFTEDPPIGLLLMPTQVPPTDQNNELDSLLTSLLSPSHHTHSQSRGSPSHYRHTSSRNRIGVLEDASLTDLPQYSEHRASNFDSQRQFNYGDESSQNGPRTHRKTETLRSFEPQLHSTAVGATSLRHERAPRVHYSDTVLYLGGQPGKFSSARHTTATSRVSSHDHGRSIQSNLPTGIDSVSSNDFKSTRQHTATSSRYHGGNSHRLSSSATRHDDVMDGWSLDDDKDVLMADDLDASPQNLSDDLLLGGASYGDLCHLQEDGELSDISELLAVPPQPRPTASVSVVPPEVISTGCYLWINYFM